MLAESVVSVALKLVVDTQLASQVHLLGAPLDWSGAFARMIADEVRHTEICARMGEVLGAEKQVEIEPSELHLVPGADSDSFVTARALFAELAIPVTSAAATR